METLAIKITHQQLQREDISDDIEFVWEVSWTEKGRWAKEFKDFDDAVVFAKRLGAK